MHLFLAAFDLEVSRTLPCELCSNHMYSTRTWYFTPDAWKQICWEIGEWRAGGKKPPDRNSMIELELLALTRVTLRLRTVHAGLLFMTQSRAKPGPFCAGFLLRFITPAQGMIGESACMYTVKEGYSI